MAEQPATDTPLTHSAPSRTPRKMGVLVALWLGLAALWAGLQVHPVLLGVLVAATLPLAWEVWTNAAYALTVQGTRLSYTTPRGTTPVDLGQVDRAILATRLDLSHRLQLRMKDGTRHTPPPACLPPPDPLRGALEDAGVTVERRLFSLLG